MSEPAWVTRMTKATDDGGYHCSGFEANGVAKEWRRQRAEIKRLQQERDEAIALLRRVYFAVDREEWEDGEKWADVAVEIKPLLEE